MLFERSRIGVSLTEAGLRFHESVLLAPGARHDGAAGIAEFPDEDGTEVAIACSGELSHLFVMQRYEAPKAALGDHTQSVLRRSLQPVCLLTRRTFPIFSEDAASREAAFLR